MLQGRSGGPVASPLTPLQTPPIIPSLLTTEADEEAEEDLLVNTEQTSEVEKILQDVAYEMDEIVVEEEEILEEEEDDDDDTDNDVNDIRRINAEERE